MHELTHAECLEFLEQAEDKNALERFTKRMLQIISIQEQDFRHCPNKGCNYIGTIDMRPSNNQLN